MGFDGEKALLATVAAIVASVITALVTIFVRGMSRTETIEKRLEHWQTETVKRCQAENRELREQVQHLEQEVGRLFNIEVAYQLVRQDLAVRAPTSASLAQAEAIMRVTLAAAPPEHMTQKLREIDAATDRSEAARRDAAD